MWSVGCRLPTPGLGDRFRFESLGLGFMSYIYYVSAKPIALSLCVCCRWRMNKVSNMKVRRQTCSHCQIILLVAYHAIPNKKNSI